MLSEAKETDEKYEKFEGLGYESAHFLTNLGSLLVIILVQLFLIPVYYGISVFPKCHKKARDYSSKSLNSCFWNGVLTFIDGTFLLLVLAALFNVKQNYEGSVEKDASYYLAIVALLICALELIIVPIFFFRQSKKKKLGSEKNINRCGYIYSDLNYRIRGGWALSYPILYQLRFIILTFLILFVQDFLVIQVLVI